MLSVSHIAWNIDRETEALSLLADQGIRNVELAPLRAFGNPMKISERTVREKTEWYQQLGFGVSSFQALLFGTSELHLFAGEDSRKRLEDWFLAVARVAGWAGARSLVFGSPRNRLKGDLDINAAFRIAVPFFRKIGDRCAEYGTCLLIEPNPPRYGADFCTDVTDSIALVEAVGSPGFKLHLDAGGLAITGEPFENVLQAHPELIGHIHASQPDLSDWTEPETVHSRIADFLGRIGYSGDVALEMKAQPDELGELRTAIKAFSEIYGRWQ